MRLSLFPFLAAALVLCGSAATVMAVDLCPPGPAPACDPTDPLDRAPASGSGTAADPFVIEDCCQLQGIADSQGSYHELGNDIDCSATPTWNAGAGFVPIGGNNGLIYHNGGLDGNGFAIADLFIDEAGFTGLFARARDLTIENVDLVDVDISGTLNVGGIAGDAFDGTVISACSVSGSISGTVSVIGGIVGNLGSGGSIVGCSSSADVSGGATVGGLAGSATNSDGIDSCFADAAVSATHTAGGAAGSFGGAISPSAITDTCVEGSVTAGFNDGGLTGKLLAGGSVVSSYWDNNQAVCIGLDLSGGVPDCSTPCPAPPPDCDPTDPADRAPSSGSGTAADPFVATDCCELQGIADGQGDYYALGNDIDCAASAGWNGGAGFVPVGGNGGLIYNGGGLDGQGFSVVDLFIDDVLYTGLYARAAGVTIENLTLVNADVSGSFIVGGVVGNAYNGTTLTAVHAVDSRVSGSSMQVGGLVGSAGSGTTFDGCTYTGDVSGTASVGGLVGVATNTGGITDCHTDAEIVATSHSVGGLVGNFGGAISPAAITESCAFGDVDTGGYTFRVGGLVGYVTPGGSVVDSNWENDQPECVGQDLGSGTSCTFECPCP